jgi:hypothetical protein
MSHATQVGQMMIDKEKHRFPLVQLSAVAETIRRVGPERVVLSSDSGSHVLPPWSRAASGASGSSSLTMFNSNG